MEAWLGRCSSSGQRRGPFVDQGVSVAELTSAERKAGSRETRHVAAVGGDEEPDLTCVDSQSAGRWLPAGSNSPTRFGVVPRGIISGSSLRGERQSRHLRGWK